MKRTLLTFIFFLGLALLLTNSLFLYPTEFVPQAAYTDYHHFDWNYWWIRHALSEGQDIYHTNDVLQPIPDVYLGLHTLTLIWFPIWAMLEPLVGNILAVNSIIWLGLALTGFFTTRLFYQESKSYPFVILGGIILMIQPALRNIAEHNHLNLLGVFFFPLTILLWKQTTHTQQWRWAIMLGFVAWLMWLMDTMWLLLSLPILLPYALYHHRRNPILHGILALFIFGTLSYGIAPFRQINSFDRSLISPADRVAAERWSVDFKMYAFQPEDIEVGRSIGHLLMIGLIISVFIKSENRERWLWFTVAIVCLLLTLGSDETIAGQHLNMPYWYLHQLLGGQFRVPERFMLPFVFAALMFINQTWGAKFQALSAKKQLALTVILFLSFAADLHLLRPFIAGKPYQSLDFYEVISTESEDYVVMDAPVSMGSGWADVGRNYYTQYHAITHGKRVINGYLARVPDSYHEFFRNETVLGWLGGFHNLQPDTISTFQNYVENLPIGYVIVHQDKTAPNQAEYFIGELNALDFLCPVTVEGVAMIYGTSANPQRCQDRIPPEIAPNTWQIDFGLPGDEFFIGYGFHRQEIIGGPAGRWLGANHQDNTLIYLELPPNQNYQLTFEATAFDHPRSVQIFANDIKIGDAIVQDVGYGQYSVSLPATSDQSIILRIQTDIPNAAPDGRALSIALNWLRIEKSQ